MNHATIPAAPRSAVGRCGQRFARQRLALAAAAVLALLLLLALFAPWVAPYDPMSQNLRNILQGPSMAHWLGTDELGRDTLSRIIYAARISLQAAFFATGLAALLGIPLGLLAGYYRGIVDRMAMVVVDMLITLPPLILAFAILALLGPGMSNVILAIGLLLSANYLRLTRGLVLVERERLYVASAKVGGIAAPAILLRHILPNIAPPLIVQSAQFCAVVMLIEASLSFLGLGATANDPSWGSMLAAAQSFLMRQPFLPFPPGLALTITVLAFNLLGDGLRDALDVTAQGNKGAQKKALSSPLSHNVGEGAGGEGHPSQSKRLSATSEANVLSAPERNAGGFVGEGHHAPSLPTTPNLLPPTTELLAVRGLAVEFPSPQGQTLTILHDVSFNLAPGETLGIVGESGSGKSMTALALLGLIPPPGRISAGAIWLSGRNLVGLPEAELRRVRGREIAMVSQEPMAALDPLQSVGQQLIAPLRRHHGLGRHQAREHAIELLALVRVPNPRQRIDDYPHQLSGGLAQRVTLARALACNQRLLVADEPTTALDVTVQGQILNMLTDIQRQLGMALIVITHDLAVIAEVCDHVLVMYAGEVVEQAPTQELFQMPRHPYSAALLSALAQHERPGMRLPVLPGMVPSANQWPTGCRFHPRCSYATEACRQYAPVLQPLNEGQASRCMRLHEIECMVLR
ncbi:MAG: dipeptide/oligopeptide/nickel ABC transporter permease/ATP-binding protein [Candidatus Viridilinea halotolerans]|uniref:Dipeptide/oligopeptide/nickel ABC transporter permease/ATP-binding protein n=1 Tax=Candidatus Viridilinea halotolerans TaxID=2491704 RepID=A0A426TVR4_9CHLR|nr:MAG: dipeptide/oligopeptide/nickel ABC transporter permease/ATP-binding protein [Candidatus Viridilinea halotolerans]